MRKVFKYTVNLTAFPTRVEIPQESRFLHAGMQNGVPQIWVEVDPSLPTDVHTFFLVGTGHEITLDDAVYVATVYNPDATFVWHIYELPTP